MEGRACHTEHAPDSHQRKTVPQWRHGGSPATETAVGGQQFGCKDSENFSFRKGEIPFFRNFVRILSFSLYKGSLGD